MTIDKGFNGRQAGDPASGAQAAAGAAITFRLDPGSGVPTYLQLVHQVEQSLRLGYLIEGDRLPTVKEAVEALAINPNTVLKAYRELEHRGLAAGRPGQGTFIAGTLHHVGLAEQSTLRKSLLAWLRAADEAGLDADGMQALFAASLRDFSQGRDDSARSRGAGSGHAGRGPAARTRGKRGNVA